MKGSSKCKDPSYTINEVYYYISDCIKNNLNTNEKDIVSKYFEIKSYYNNFLDNIKLKYQQQWDDIKKQYDVVSNILLENFSELENDVNFELTTTLIESIGNEASKKVNQLITTTDIHMGKTHIILPEIIIDFENKMEQIYKDVISSKKFDKLINDALLDMYGVEKEIHRMSLSLKNCSNVLTNIMI